MNDRGVCRAAPGFARVCKKFDKKRKYLKSEVTYNHLYLLNVASTDLLKTLASLSQALGRLEAAGEGCTDK